MNECPCKDCISFPICKNKMKEYCEQHNKLFSKTFFETINPCKIALDYLGNNRADKRNFYIRKRIMLDIFKLSKYKDSTKINDCP